jgi:hypothetical protein
MGQSVGALHGPFSLGKVRNFSSYVSAPSSLQTQLLKKLNQQSLVRFGDKALNGTLIEIDILEIKKSNLDQDELGRSTELQFNIRCEVTTSTSKREASKVQLSNQDLLRSSGSYRPPDQGDAYNGTQQTLSEDEALNLAIQDLVQRIVQHLASVQN